MLNGAHASQICRPGLRLVCTYSRPRISADMEQAKAAEALHRNAKYAQLCAQFTEAAKPGHVPKVIPPRPPWRLQRVGAPRPSAAAIPPVPSKRPGAYASVPNAAPKAKPVAKALKSQPAKGPVQPKGPPPQWVGPPPQSLQPAKAPVQPKGPPPQSLPQSQAAKKPAQPKEPPPQSLLLQMARPDELQELMATACPEGKFAGPSSEVATAAAHLWERVNQSSGAHGKRPTCVHSPLPPADLGPAPQEQPQKRQKLAAPVSKSAGGYVPVKRRWLCLRRTSVCSQWSQCLPPRWNQSPWTRMRWTDWSEMPFR